MDRRTVVDQPDPLSATIQVEQAIFTSVRSPMGTGYRIVAASPGISADERKEITQCAPSHGSLCDPSPDAVGLASFELRSGRRGLFLVRNAGVEHTARGGCRVHTHVLATDSGGFEEFRCDPLAIGAAALPAISTELPRHHPARLDPLSLTPSNRPQDSARAPAPAIADLDRLTLILSAILAGHRTLVLGVAEPAEALRLLLSAIPTAIRARLSLSCGIKFAPSRPFQLVFADADQHEVTRITRNHEIDLIQWDSASPPTESPFQPWLRFARRHWESGRTNELDLLSAKLTQDSTASALQQIVTLVTDLEQLEHAEAALLDQLALKHAHDRPQSAAQARLLNDFRKAAEARREALTQDAEKGSPDGDTPLEIHRQPSGADDRNPSCSDPARMNGCGANRPNEE